MHKIFLHLFVFFTGAAILTLEMAASRLLAPFFGTSLFVWGNIIGVVLGALALGYYHGGRLADRSPHKETLGFVTWAGGLLTCFIPLISPFVLHNITEVLSGMPLFLIIASFISMLALFALPLVLLGALTPLATRIGVREITEVGSVAGSLGASSTTGSLVGAFLPSFVLVPLLGTRLTILIAGMVLLILGSLAIGRRRFLLGLTLPIVLIAIGSNIVRSAEGAVFEKESAYQYIQVVEQDGQLHLLTEEGSGVQSSSMGTDGLTDSYTDALAVTPLLFEPARPLRILVIGVAGGSVIRQMHYFNDSGRDLYIDAVEIDPEMFEIARDFFGLKDSDANLISADGRTHLRNTDQTYDIVIVDAYQEELYIPFHLATQEFYASVREHLAPDGILALNILGYSSSDPLITHLEETVHSVFKTTATTQLPSSFNHLVLGSQSPINWIRLNGTDGTLQPITETILNNYRYVASADHLLTDDKAPIEYLTDRFLWKAATK